MANQWIEINGVETRICGGGFGIFGHGNVTCLGEALYAHRDELPLYRGQNEQGMGFAAAGYAKAWLRRRFMFCTASAGPGTANLLTSAALAHANRQPRLQAPSKRKMTVQTSGRIPTASRSSCMKGLAISRARSAPASNRASILAGSAISSS